MKEIGHRGWHEQQPIRCEIEFILPRPRTLHRKVQHPAKRPDLDKLVRAVLDALLYLVYEDDSQVVHLITEKRFAFAGESPGAWILFDEQKEEPRSEK